MFIHGIGLNTSSDRASILKEYTDTYIRKKLTANELIISGITFEKEYIK